VKPFIVLPFEGEPYATIWTRRADGLIVCAAVRSHKRDLVEAWNQHAAPRLEAGASA